MGGGLCVILLMWEPTKIGYARELLPGSMTRLSKCNGRLSELFSTLI